jgi:hypothetical protein
MKIKPFQRLTRAELTRLRLVKNLAKHGPKLPRRRLADFVMRLARSQRLA